MSDEAPDTGDQSPLQVGIEGQCLVIRIGLGTLEHVVNHCPMLEQCEPRPVLVNREEMIKDVIHTLESEAEDGSTPVHYLIDQAILDAYEGGSLGFEESELLLGEESEGSEDGDE